MGPGVRVPSPRPSTKKLHTSALGMVGIAQLVRAPDCGSGGREFESHYPPQKTLLISSVGRALDF